MTTRAPGGNRSAIRNDCLHKPPGAIRMILIRSVLYNICFYVFITVAMLVVWPIFLLPRSWGWHVVRFWAFVNLWLLRHVVGLDYEVRGRENIPEGGLLVASKHQSAWETFALISLFSNPTYILKRELTWIPLFGWYAIKFRMLPIDRGRGSAVLPALTRRAQQAVAEGRQVLIFPEGTRRPAGADPAYKYGVAHLYGELDCPCLPIALNSGLYWPRRDFLRYPGKVIVDILPPIEPGLKKDDFRARLQTSIESASDALLREAAESTVPPPLSETARRRLNT